MTDKARPERRPRKTSTRDGLFQKNGWWWLDWYDAEGKRHRKKAAPDYSTAKLMYRDLKTAIAKGEVLGVRDEQTRLREFVEKRYWPAVASTLAPEWAERSRSILDATILPTFGDARLSSLRQEPNRALVRGAARRGEGLDREQGAGAAQASPSAARSPGATQRRTQRRR